jgi:hypothetical protein
MKERDDDDVPFLPEGVRRWRRRRKRKGSPFTISVGSWADTWARFMGFHLGYCGGNKEKVDGLAGWGEREGGWAG